MVACGVFRRWINCVAILKPTAIFQRSQSWERSSRASRICWSPMSSLISLGMFLYPTRICWFYLDLILNDVSQSFTLWLILILLGWSSLGTAGLNEDGQQMQQLADACLVIDALDPSAKEELIRNVCSKELTAYQQIFQGTGPSFSPILVSIFGCYIGGWLWSKLCGLWSSAVT